YGYYKKDKGNDDNEIDMIQSLGGNENTNKLLEESHDKIKEDFIKGSFIMGLNVNIVAWNHFVNGMLFNLIKNLYVPFGISFDPKRYYKDGDCVRMLRMPRTIRHPGNIADMVHRPRDQRHQYLRFEGLQYIEGNIVDFEMRLAKIYRREVQGSSLNSKEWQASLELDQNYNLPRGKKTGYRCSLAQPHPTLLLGIQSINLSLGMDVGSVNIPYLLARYLRRFAAGRKSGALILGGQFVARLANHFRLLTEERLQGLMFISHVLPIIDMTELVRLQIYAEFGDTWAWVPAGPARQEGDAGGVAEEALEEVHGMREALQGQREVLDSMARDFSRIKPGSKFNTVVREYVTKLSRLSKSRAELRRKSVYKSVEAEEKDHAESKEINEVDEVSIIWNLLSDCSRDEHVYRKNGTKKIDDPNITMEEYTRLQEEKALSHGEAFILQTATYGKMEIVKRGTDCFTNFESEFPAIVLDDTYKEALSWEPTVSPLNDNEIDFRISFDEFDDEDYTVIYDKNSFSYKIISVNNLKTDLGNDKVNIPSFPSPEPEVSCSNDLDFFKDFENEFLAIVYNDALI
ncbi:hypothetical protein Tco_0309004, partial [Tanacetum coccineum]